MRTFESHEAVRENVPLVLGLFGASGSGKTYSALELAAGIVEVYSGDIYGIDTEERRMLHYAFDSETGRGFKFKHVPFKPPFGPADYMEAFDYVLKQKPGCIIVDSLSHEHDGPGGVLETQAALAEKLAAQWRTTIEKAGQSAWNEAKKPRKAFAQRIIQMNVPTIFCFRAREQTKLLGGKMVDCGFGPIGSTDYLYEALVSFFLEPKSNGVPTWESDRPNERMMMKIAEQFRELLNPNGRPARITREMGSAIARWCKGGANRPEEIDLQALQDIYETKRSEGMESLASWWHSLTNAQRKVLKPYHQKRKAEQ